MFLAEGSVLVNLLPVALVNYYDRFLKERVPAKDIFRFGMLRFSCSNHYFPLLSHFFLSLFHVISKVLIQ